MRGLWCDRAMPMCCALFFDQIIRNRRKTPAPGQSLSAPPSPHPSSAAPSPPSPAEGRGAGTRHGGPPDAGGATPLRTPRDEGVRVVVLVAI